MKREKLIYLAVEPGNSWEPVAAFRYKEDRDTFNEQNNTLTPQEWRENRELCGYARTQRDGTPCDKWGRTF